MTSTPIDNPKLSGSEPVNPSHQVEAEVFPEDARELLSTLTNSLKWPLSASEKRLLILLLCARLAKALAQPQDPERMEAYSEALGDLDEGTLVEVFDRAAKAMMFFPAIAELRQLAGVHEAQESDANLDAVWLFVCDYVRKHGSDGHAYVEDSKKHGADPNCPTCGGTSWETREKTIERATAEKPDLKPYIESSVVRCACFGHGHKVSAPPLPPRLIAALRSMAPCVQVALQMIQDVEPRWAGKLREDFNQAYRRAQGLENAA
jgi:hypothetical protein